MGEAADDRRLFPMFKATVENLDSSISPRSISVVESRTDSSVFSPGCDVAMNGVSKSPNGVTKDADVKPDSSAVGEGADSLLKESNSRGGSESSPSVLRLSLPKSNKKRRACQHGTDSILSLNRRDELSLILCPSVPGALASSAMDVGT